MKRRRGVIIRKFQPENVQLLPSYHISAIIAVFLEGRKVDGEILFGGRTFICAVQQLGNQCRGAFRCHRILFQRRVRR